MNIVFVSNTVQYNTKYNTTIYNFSLTLSGRGGGRLSGPDDQTHSCQSETTYSMTPKLGDFEF